MSAHYYSPRRACRENPESVWWESRASQLPFDILRSGLSRFAHRGSISVLGVGTVGLVAAASGKGYEPARNALFLAAERAKQPIQLCSDGLG